MVNTNEHSAAKRSAELRGHDLPGGQVARRRLRRRRWAALSVAVLLLYGAVLIMLSGCTDGLLLFPTTQPIKGVAAQRLTIAGPGGVIEIWKERSPGAATREPTAFVMTFTGNASRAEFDAGVVASQWGERPVEVWAVNYPGYGGSAGPARLKSIAPAALLAYDEMKRQAHNRPTFVGGRSLGTTAALYVAANRPVNGVILHSPPPLRSLIIGQFGWWNLWLAAIPVARSVPGDLDSLYNARRVNVPGVFLITGADGLVTPHYQRKVVDAYAGPKHIIVMEDTDHNDPIPDQARNELNASLDWLCSQAQVASAAAK